MIICRRSITFIIFAGILGIASVAAHEGHDHGPPPPPENVRVAPRAEAAEGDLELVAVAGEKEIRLTLDAFRTNEPIADAVIEAETPSGPAKVESVGEGRYRLAAPWLEPGTHDLIFTVSAGTSLEIMPVTLTVPEDDVGLLARVTGAAQPASVFRETAQRLPDGTLFIPKATQHTLGVRTLAAVGTPVRNALELPGRVIADPASSGVVQSAVSGRMSAPASGFPRLGARVRAGDVMAYIQPALTAGEAADLKQRSIEVDQQLTVVERRLARLKPVRDIVPRQQIEEAEIELAALRSRKAALDEAGLQGEPLRAPVSGVVAAVNASPGQLAAPDTVIFQIIDPEKLWIEAQSFDPFLDPGAVSARTSDGRSIALSHRGSGLADQGQAIPIHFAVEGSARGLRLGQPVTVVMEVGQAREGLTVPRQSIVRGENGQSIVFVHSSAERFAPREVRTEPLDADRVVVAAGITSGARVVTQGAQLLGQIR